MKNPESNIKAGPGSKVDFRSCLEFLQKQEVPDLITRLQIAGNRIERIITLMLQTWQQDKGAKSFLDINQLILRLLSTFNYQFDFGNIWEAGNVLIRHELDENLYPVLTNETEIEQILTNLLRNSVQALKESGINQHPQVIVRTISESHHVRLEVEDNGPGIDKKVMDRIFEPFFSTKQRNEGQGLGLYMVKIIVVHRLNGSIYAENLDRGGCRFVVHLPA